MTIYSISVLDCLHLLSRLSLLCFVFYCCPYVHLAFTSYLTSSWEVLNRLDRQKQLPLPTRLISTHGRNRQQGDWNEEKRCVSVLRLCLDLLIFTVCCCCSGRFTNPKCGVLGKRLNNQLSLWCVYGQILLILPLSL